MEILKDKMLPRKYWRDHRVIRNFHITLIRLSMHPDHRHTNFDYFYVQDSFNEQERWITKIFSRR